MNTALRLTVRVCVQFTLLPKTDRCAKRASPVRLVDSLPDVASLSIGTIAIVYTPLCAYVNRGGGGGGGGDYAAKGG